MYLLDTNAVSAIRKIKSGKCNLNFELWLMRQANDDLFINSVVLYELKKAHYSNGTTATSSKLIC